VADWDALDLPPRLVVLLDAVAAVVRRSASGRVALARLAPLLGEELLEERIEAPVKSRDVEKALRRAWGAPPAKVLDDWEPEPVAVRAAAQVHRGVLDGGAVAIKLRRPGLAASARSDLVLLEALAGPLRGVFGSADVPALLREARETALDELDLEHEAAGQRAAGRLLRGVEDVLVAPVHGDRCTEDVLVTGWLDGPTLAERPAPDPARCARALVRAHLVAARAGVVLTDARPGHVILLADGRVGLLGTGIARRVDRGRVAFAERALAALAAADGRSYVAAVHEGLGALDPETAAVAAAEARAILGELLDGPARLDRDVLDAVGERALERSDVGLEIAARLRVEPADLGAARAASQLVITLAHVGATLDWVGEATRPA
jgi:predicted unusual protein kinase regulating ubiquinone biosynthesis (AarF/ABC1/UbiB family)